MELLQRVKTGIEISSTMELPLAINDAAGVVVLDFGKQVPQETVGWLLSLIGGEVNSGGASLTSIKIPSEGTASESYAITASVPRLLTAAEQYKLHKRGTDGTLHGFSMSARFQFEGFSDETAQSYFSSLEQQWLIKQCLDSIAATGSEHVPGFTELRLYKERPIVSFCEAAKIIKLLPLHDVDELKMLKKKLFLTRKPWPFPIDDVRRYFGDHIALYFSFLGFYTQFLLPPCVLVVIYRLLFVDDQLEDNIWFAAINLIWATLFLELWKRKSSEITFGWSSQNASLGVSSLLKQPRAEFRGESRVSPITGNVEPYYPWWKRMVKMYCVTYPLLLVCLGLAVFGMWVYLEFQRNMTERIANAHGITAVVMKRLPSMLYSGAIYLTNNGYNRIAKRMNDWENHRLQSNYDRHLIIKLVLFYSVNGFLSLFYIAFYLQNMALLRQHLATLLITQQIIQQVQESLIPYIKYKRHSITVTTEGTKVQLKQSTAGDRIEQERRLPVYEDTFGDYLELYLQFGYVFLFSAAYPLASFWAVVNNVIEVKSDAFKLTHLYQRPFKTKVTDIGAWQIAFEIMSIVAVLTNCGLIALSEHTKQAFKGLTSTQYILVFVLLEHAIILIKIMITYAIPDTPGWIRKKTAKEEYQRHVALKEMDHTQGIYKTDEPQLHSTKDD